MAKDLGNIHQSATGEMVYRPRPGLRACTACIAAIGLAQKIDAPVLMLIVEKNGDKLPAITAYPDSDPRLLFRRYLFERDNPLAPR